MIRLVSLVALALALSSACKLKEDPASAGGKPQVPAPPDVAAPPPDALRTPSGLASKVLFVGMGSFHPTLRSTVTVRYTGWTTDGMMFDTSGREAVTFGVTQVIPGWQEVLQLMRMGERRRVWIPGHLAYDNVPDPSAPKGMLVFDIELLDIR
jgi:peptidylprolyl isomerase